MLICQLAVQKSVKLLGKAEGIDGLCRSLPSLDRGVDSAAVVLYLQSRDLWPRCSPLVGCFCGSFVLCVRISLFLILPLFLSNQRRKCSGWFPSVQSRRLPSWLHSSQRRMPRYATASLLFVLLRCNCARWSCCIQACKEVRPDAL